MEKNKAKLKNMLRPIVNELVKESLFSEKGILSGIIQECVQGLTKEVIFEKKTTQNTPVLQESFDVEKQQTEEDAELEKLIRDKRVLKAREDFEKQKRMMNATGFKKMFQNLEPFGDSEVMNENLNSTQEDVGPLRNVRGKGVDISGIMAVAKGGASGWKKQIKKG